MTELLVLLGGSAVVLAALAMTSAGIYFMAVVGVLMVVLGPLLLSGLRLTTDFLKSLASSKKRQAKIGGYTDQFSTDKSAEDRNADYASLVDSYYDLATEFYEWGWGTSFHFADRRKNESFRESIVRHEHYLAGRLGVKKGAKLLDCGCGIGGPARNIARFTGADVKAVTINEFQVNRGNTISKKEGIFGQVELVQADFMQLPFEDCSFDGVYAIESTCHAPDRSKVYGEILRVLKPGAVFACYEWCLTDEFDGKNAQHQKIKEDIMLGDGLPDLVHTSVCTEALKKAGFDVLEVRDCAQDGHLEGGEPWYMPLVASWNPTKWPRFQFNPIMFALMPVLLRALEIVGLVPDGTKNTQVMLQAGGIGCAQGGETGSFTPMWLMVARKPLDAKQ